MPQRRLSASRSLVCDILHYDRHIPSFAHTRTMDLAAVEELRQQAEVRISWAVLFIRAYGLLSAEFPVLRQVILNWPWPHVYEHPHPIGTLAMSREYQGEPRLFWMRLRRPDERSLADLQADLRRHQHGDVEKHFRRQIRLSQMPTVLRRAAWWMTFNLSGHKRATRLGTFALTTLAGQGVTIDRPPSIHTSTLTYGPLDENGHCRVTITYDHRLMDGMAIAQCLVRLEQILLGRVTRELADLPNAAVADTPARDMRPVIAAV